VSEPTESNKTSQPARRVIVAEDETLIRLDIIEILRGEGYDVIGEADNGEKAVQLAEELKPDLVLMDVKMPVMDGITAAEKIVKARIAPVVLLTAFSQKELVERAKSLLTTKMGLTEPEAFRWIQKTSMDRRLSMREVAETIINQVN
jgi:AmiR/NasT family two-component response regulator